MRILVVEDDSILRDGLSVGLKLASFATDAVATLADARLALAGARYEAMILDLTLPDGGGLDLLKELRIRGDHIPVLLLTAKDEVAHRIAGLDAGADDYLGKPFDLDELAARMRALVRRREGNSPLRSANDDLILDAGRMCVVRQGREIELTRREFGVLRVLLARRGTIVEKSELEDGIYGWQEEVESNAVEVHIHHLRNKLGREMIETVRGVGYRMVEREK